MIFLYVFGSVFVREFDIIRNVFCVVWGSRLLGCEVFVVLFWVYF